MFKKLSENINKNIAIYFKTGYYEKVFKEENESDCFYIVLDKRYAIEIVVNYMDDTVIFYILKLDVDGNIDKSPGYYKFDNGSWKREYLEVICSNLGIEYDNSLLKKAGSLDYQHNENKDTYIDRINMQFEAFKFLFKEYKTILIDSPAICRMFK